MALREFIQLNCVKTKRRDESCGTLDCLLFDHTLFVPEDIFYVREEDLTLPKCDGSQTEKHRPYRAHQDGHHRVQDKEAWDLKGIAEDAQARNPAHVRERQGPAYEDAKSRKTSVPVARTMGRREKRVLTSEDFMEVLVDFEPVWQEAKSEEEDGKAEEEDSNEHARGEPDLARKRRDEIVLRKAIEQRA